MATGLMVELAMNTARVRDDVRQVQNSLMGMQKSIERSSMGTISAINKLWVGMVMKIYMAEKAVQTLVSAFGKLYGPVEEFNLSVTQMAAQITNMMEKTKNTDIAAQYQEAKKYATDLALAMEKLDAETVATSKDLRSMNEQMITAGTALNIYNPDELEAFKNIANAVAVVSSQYANKEVQVRQEIRALMNGEVKTTNVLATQLQALVAGPLEEEVKKHKEAGDLVLWMGNLLRGYSAASSDIESTWAAIGTSLKTSWDIIARTGFSQGYRDINSSLKEMNDWLRKNGDTISNVINIAWETTIGLLKVGRDTLKVFKEEFIGVGYISLEVLNVILQMVQALPNTAQGIKNIGLFIQEWGSGLKAWATLDLGGAEQAGNRMWELMWLKRKEFANSQLEVVQQRLMNIVNPPDLSAYDISGWGGGSVKGSVPELLSPKSETDKGANKALKQYKQMTEALDRFKDAVTKSNPALSELDKRLWQISDDAEDLARKLGNMEHLTTEQRESFAQGILDTEALAESYALLAHEMEVEKIVQERVVELLGEEKQRRLDLIEILDMQKRSQIDILNNSEMSKMNEMVKYGAATKGDAAAVEFKQRQRLIDLAKESYAMKLSQMETDEELMGMQKEWVEIQNSHNASVQQYLDIMGSFDVALDAFEKQHELLNSLRDAWGLTNDEIYQKTVNVWEDVGDVISNASLAMSNTFSNIMVGFIDGTVDARKAIQDLSKAILGDVIQALVKVGVQQVLLATIGNTIQATSTAATVASMQAVYASASAAAAALSMATWGASASAGSAAYMMGMGSSMAFSKALGAGLFGQPQGMAEGGVIREHIIGRGTSGQMYEFGEKGPERVTPMRKGTASNIVININGNVLNNYDQLARVLVPAIRKAEYDGV